MRLYTFCNQYLSSIQNGIQSLHVVSEMMIKYLGGTMPPGAPQPIMLREWARDHKTAILLNAGYSQELHSLIEFFSTPVNPYPWAPFFEGLDALDGALTCVGVVIPEKIYNVSTILREGKEFYDLFSAAKAAKGKLESFTQFNINDYIDWELELAGRLNDYGLAK